MMTLFMRISDGLAYLVKHSQYVAFSRHAGIFAKPDDRACGCSLYFNLDEKYVQLPHLHYFGVPVLGVVAVGVVVVPAPAALLFLRSFFSFFSFVTGVVGLFSPPFVDFLTGAGRSSVFNSCGVGASTSFTGGGTVSDCDDLLVDMEEVNVESCDFVNLKDPGSPTMGFSSIYSLP